MRLFRVTLICTFFILSTFSYAGLGGGNPTGNFGNSDNNVRMEQPNSTGGFGILGGGELPDDIDPGGNIPPADIPLDGGAAILIAIGLGVGGRRIYKKIMNP
jgi:hypothetical protein